MKITQTAGTYQLSEQQEIEITENNPLLTDVGSKSLPITLPPTQHNFNLLDNPQRIARKTKYNNRHRFVISHGVFRKTGTQVIFSASKTEGIQTTFYLKEGEFYTKIKNITLPELDWGGEQDLFTGTTEQKVNKWIALFEQLMQGSIEKEICIFPVITKYDEPLDSEGYRRTDNPNTELLNQPDKQNKLVIVTKHDETDVPHGYGITPFLRLSYVLDKLFSNFGYTLKPTLWHTDTDFKKLVLLNNTADAIVTGKLDYANLLPTVEVDKFLDCICKKFNCAFDIEEDKQTVEFYFLENLLLQQPQKDLTPYLDADIEEIVFNDFKEISLSAGTSIDFANPDTVSFTDFKKKYTKIIEVTESEYSNAPQSVDTLYFRKALGSYYKKVTENNRPLNKRVSSCFFTLNHSENAKSESIQNISTDDEQTPILQTVIYGNGNHKIRLPCPFIGNRRHVNTALKVDGVIQEEEKQSMQIMFCFSIGIINYHTTWANTDYNTKLSVGTPFEYNPKGELWGKASLRFHGEQGLYKRFFARTDATLRNSFSPVSCKLHLPVTELLKFNFNTLYLLKGQPVLLYSNQYSISDNGVKYNKAEFRTTRLLEPLSLFVDQTTEVLPPQTVYYWQQINNLDELRAKHGGTAQQRWLFELFTGAKPVQPSTQPTQALFEQAGKTNYNTYDIKLYAQKDAVFRPHVGVIYTDKLQAWYEVKKFENLNRAVFFWKECSNIYELAAKDFHSNYICQGQREYQDKNNQPPAIADLPKCTLNDFLSLKKIAQAQYPIYLYRVSVQSGGTHAGKVKETLTVWFEPDFKII